MPDAVEMTEALADSDFTNAKLQMERAACRICSHDLGLQGPVFFVFDGGDQLFEERTAEARPLRCFIEIDADLSDADRPSCIGSRG